MSDLTKIDRDALTELLTAQFPYPEFLDDQDRKTIRDQADAVIAHLSTLPAEVEVEWGIRYDDGVVDTDFNEPRARAWVKSWAGENDTIVRRKAGPWEVVSDE